MKNQSQRALIKLRSATKNWKRTKGNRRQYWHDRRMYWFDRFDKATPINEQLALAS